MAFFIHCNGATEWVEVVGPVYEAQGLRDLLLNLKSHTVNEVKSGRTLIFRVDGEGDKLLAFASDQLR